MKKLLLLIISILFITGCTANINIDINKDTVKEEYTIYGNNSDYNEIKETATYPTPLFYDAEVENPYSPTGKKQSGIQYYDSKYDDTNKKVTITGTFNLKEHIKSSVVGNCFQYYNITDDDETGETTFSTSSGLTCEFNKFTLRIKTPYKVTQNNADSVNSAENIYVWKFNDKNSNNKSVIITINFSETYNGQNNNQNPNVDNNTDDTTTNETKKDSSLTPIIIISIIIVIIMLAIILKVKQRKVSKL